MKANNNATCSSQNRNVDEALTPGLDLDASEIGYFETEYRENFVTMVAEVNNAFFVAFVWVIKEKSKCQFNVTLTSIFNRFIRISNNSMRSEKLLRNKRIRPSIPKSETVISKVFCYKK